MNRIDARGLSCPEPVLQARQVVLPLVAGDKVEVLVDAAVARENVVRMATTLGCKTTWEQEGETFRILIEKE